MFVDIQAMPSVLDLSAHLCGRSMPEPDRLIGRVVLNKETSMPVAFALIYFEPDGTVSVQASFGELLKTYPREMLAEMARTCQIAVDMGVKSLYAIADETIDGSTKLIEWMGGENTGVYNPEPPIGYIYRMDTDNPKMAAWLAARGRP